MSARRKAPASSFNAGPRTGVVRLNPDHFPNGPDPDAYATNVVGDCMAPEINSGDMVIVSPAAPVEVGKFVVLWPADGSRPWVKRLCMAPRVPVGTPVHPSSEVVDAVVVEMLNPHRVAAIEITRLRAMHRVVGIYREEDLPAMQVVKARRRTAGAAK